MKRVIVIGGGHAGIEAVNIISKMNINSILITKNLNDIGELSCNPSMGGIGKSNLIKEVDFLEGCIGYLSTISSLQLKTINISKGEAVKCTRSQICRKRYKTYTKKILKKNNIKIIQDEVKKIIIKDNKVKGVKTVNNIYKSEAVIVTTGTFLNSKIYIGKKKYKEGRINEKNSTSLSKQLEYIIGDYGKLKTGTSPRISYKNINFKNLNFQKGENNPIPTLSNKIFIKKNYKNKKCWITNTTELTNEIIKKKLKNSSIYKNLITGNSPRYCPSIEDKIYKFYNKKKHNIFLEPDEKNQIYLNGISTSLDYKSQKELIKSIKGLEKSEIKKLGYSVEYTFFNPKNLKNSLESKKIKGLFLSGQINGTTGYEEAAAQGILAGINCCLYLKNKKYWYPNKKNSYMGLMIKDIINNGITEPYRIFTNKSKNNLILRENNCFDRLKNIYKNLNFNNKLKYNFFLNKKKIKIIIFNNIIIFKNIKKQIKVYYKYKGYIKIKKIFFKKRNKENIIYLNNINFFKIKNLSKELCEKLNKINKNDLKYLNINNINKESLNLIKKYIKN